MFPYGNICGKPALSKFNGHTPGVEGIQIKGGHISRGALHIGDIQDGLGGADGTDDPHPLAVETHGTRHMSSRL